MEKTIKIKLLQDIVHPKTPKDTISELCHKDDIIEVNDLTHLDINGIKYEIVKDKDTLADKTKTEIKSFK